MKFEIDEIINEVKQVFDTIDDSEVNRFIDGIMDAYYNKYKIVAFGAGRMGIALKAFVMRLNHFGIKAYYYTDICLPPLHHEDIFLFSSGSGRTKTVCDLADTAKQKADCRIFSIVGDADSPLAKKSNMVLSYTGCDGGLNSADKKGKIHTNQIMSTLNEQVTYLLFDVIANKMRKQITDDLTRFHNNIE